MQAATSAETARGWRDAVQWRMESLDAFELETVVRAVALTRRFRLSAAARGATKLGNGWVYPLASAGALTVPGVVPLRFLAASATSLAVAFLFYPVLKRWLRRLRPCDHVPSLGGGIAPLDRYSFPSGHAMTASAWAVPLVLAWPQGTPLAAGFCLLVAWSRVALGHHYPSDVAAGALLGGAVALTVGALLC